MKKQNNGPRNLPCRCGSGIKNKKCCGNAADAAARNQLAWSAPTQSVAETGAPDAVIDDQVIDHKTTRMNRGTNMQMAVYMALAAGLMGGGRR